MNYDFEMDEKIIQNEQHFIRIIKEQNEILDNARSLLIQAKKELGEDKKYYCFSDCIESINNLLGNENEK